MLRREAVAEEMRSLDQPARAQLRKYGVRFGAFNIYFPALLKPASAELAVVLWTLEARRRARRSTSRPCPSRRGRGSHRSLPTTAVPEAFYRVAGFHVCGPRAVRIDMLERLADLIRPLWPGGPTPPIPVRPPRGRRATAASGQPRR